MNENEQRIKEKIDFFFTEKVKVHIELKDKTFLNGIIASEVKDNVWWLQEDKLGKVFVFLKDIYDIDQFTEARK